MADTVIGLALLIVLLVTGWTGKLRDWSLMGSKQHYFLAVFLYVLMFSVIAKVLNAPFDFVGFRLEHQYHLSNQKLRGWLWDECKGWLVSLVLGTIMVELVYGIIRLAPQRWWIIAWAVFVGLFLLMAQLAPVILMPIFYKFEPLANDGLRDRLTQAGRARRHSRPRRLRVEAVGKVEQGERCAHRHGIDPTHHPLRHLAAKLQR